MNKLNFAQGACVSRFGRAGRLALALVFLSSMTLSPALWAGAFIFAGEGNGVDVITHPKGYTGNGGVLNVGVCISPASDFQAELEIPLRNNISVWNDLQPVASNLVPGAVSGLDVESVLLHEVGHCIGLAHVNAASESGLSENDYTKATNGLNDVFNVNPGPDGIPGTFDDIRGDDENLHWFNPNNDPFQLPIHTPVDTSQYRRDVSELPPGDSFAQNASREMAAYYGLPPAEAVMQQLTYYSETQRELVSDGAVTVMLAGSGLDETAGTGDDYQLVLTYEGVSDDPNLCDISVSIENTGSFAYCSTGGSFVGSGHARITSASVFLGNTYNWHFNTELRDSGGNQPPAAGADSGTVDEDGSVNIAVLGNDSDPDDDPLDVTGVSDPPNGSASVNGDNTINYAPDANFNGPDSFSYTLSDGKGGTDTGSVSVTVNPVNDAPVAVNDTGATTEQDIPVEVFVLDNDSDVDNDPLNVSAVSNGTQGTVTNNNGSVTYSPNPGTTGADSFGYTVSDGSATDTATVSVNVLAANIPPTAFFASSCDGTTCTFDASGSNDPDGGTIVDYRWDFGDTSTGSGLNPAHSYPSAGTYTVTLTITDDRSDTGVYSDDVAPTPDPITPDYAVADFNTVDGTLSGSFQDTWDIGGAAQSVEEIHSGGKPSRRSDSLEHIWQFNLAEGNTTFNVVASGDFQSDDLDTAFTFQWSTSSNGGWTDMVTVPGASSTFDIGSGVSGTIYVRVIDNNSSGGNTALSTVNIDHMYFDGATPPTEAPARALNPDPSNGASGIPVNTTLSWSAGAGTETHDVYFGTTPGSLSLASNGQTGTSYSPGTLNTSTTYYWRVDETNTIGTTVGNEWSFVTSANTGPTELQVTSIVLSTVNAGKGNKNGQAVVTVVDDLGNPIGGATVTAEFSGSFNESVSGSTSGSGSVTFTTDATAKGGASFTFCVTEISGPLPYNAGQFCENY